MRSLSIIIFLLAATAATTFSQIVTDLYQYHYTTVSPAFAGTAGNKITFQGSLWLDEHDNSVATSFIGAEFNIKKINSGIGFNATTFRGEEDLSLMNVIYNYHFKIGEKSKFIVGTRLSSLQVSSRVYAATGFVGNIGVQLKGPRAYAGVSIDNVVTSELRHFNYFTTRVWNIIVGRDIKVGEDFESMNSVYVATAKEDWFVSANTSVVIKKLVILGLSLDFAKDIDDVFWKGNAGIRFGDVGRVLFSVYTKSFQVVPERKFSGQMMLQFNLSKNEE